MSEDNPNFNREELISDLDRAQILLKELIYKTKVGQEGEFTTSISSDELRVMSELSASLFLHRILLNPLTHDQIEILKAKNRYNFLKQLIEKLKD